MVRSGVEEMIPMTRTNPTRSFLKQEQINRSMVDDIAKYSQGYHEDDWNSEDVELQIHSDIP